MIFNVFQIYRLDDTHVNAIKAMLTNPPAATTTTTTATPDVPEEISNEQFQTVDQKLNNITSKLNLVTAVVFTFVILAVFILAAFSVIQFWQNKKFLQRDHELPKYIAPYETKP